MKTVSQVAQESGVSVRTLHHYDAIGLLHPTCVTEAGYRLYDDAALLQLQQILFFRELGFSLKEIAAIRSAPSFDPRQAMERQREMLRQQRQRLDGLIALIDRQLQQEKHITFKEFDMKEIEKMKQQYAEEVKQRWGNTEAYAESQKKHAAYGKPEQAQMMQESDAILAAFGAAAAAGEDPAGAQAQALVRQWQAHITKWHYHCTTQILAGLGQMYTADPRFQENIDRNGAGTAAFMQRAIAVYCASEVEKS